jgi:hypothetical protein
VQRSKYPFDGIVDEMLRTHCIVPRLLDARSSLDECSTLQLNPSDGLLREKCEPEPEPSLTTYTESDDARTVQSKFSRHKAFKAPGLLFHAQAATGGSSLLPTIGQISLIRTRRLLRIGHKVASVYACRLNTLVAQNLHVMVDLEELDPSHTTPGPRK